MKINKELDGDRVTVNLTSESDDTFSFSYNLSNPSYIRFMSVTRNLNKKHNKLAEEDKSKQGEAMLDLYEAAARAIGNSTYDEILDFYDSNNEELSFETMFSFVTMNDLEDELPKE